MTSGGSRPARPAKLRPGDPFYIAVVLLLMAQGAGGLVSGPIDLGYYEVSAGAFVAMLLALLFASKFVTMFRRLGGGGRRLWKVCLAFMAAGIVAALWAIAAGHSSSQTFGLTVVGWVLCGGSLLLAAFEDELNPVYDDEIEPGSAVGAADDSAAAPAAAHDPRVD